MAAELVGLMTVVVSMMMMVVMVTIEEGMRREKNTKRFTSEVELFRGYGIHRYVLRTARSMHAFPLLLPNPRHLQVIPLLLHVGYVSDAPFSPR